jgi:hypothetical protein
MAAIFGLFLFAISLIIISANMMVWIMSFFYETHKDYDDNDKYVNPYRLVPRQEAESYKRYERREYQDSLKNRRKCK